MDQEPRFRGVGLAITNPSRDRFLLQQKDASYPRFPLCYSFFGGGVEARESAREALIRELGEELPAPAGNRLIESSWIEIWSKDLSSPEGVFGFTLFEAQLSNSALDTLAASEVYEGRRAALVTAGEMRNLPFVWGLEAVLPSLLEPNSQG